MKKLSTIGFCISVLIGGDLLAMQRDGSFVEGRAPAMADVDRDAIRSWFSVRPPKDCGPELCIAAMNSNLKDVFEFAFNRYVSVEFFEQAALNAVASGEPLILAVILASRFENTKEQGDFVSRLSPILPMEDGTWKRPQAGTFLPGIIGKLLAETASSARRSQNARYLLRGGASLQGLTSSRKMQKFLAAVCQ